MPVSLGRCDRSWVKASRPPAEAPMPTSGNSLRGGEGVLGFFELVFWLALPLPAAADIGGFEPPFVVVPLFFFEACTLSLRTLGTGSLLVEAYQDGGGRGEGGFRYSLGLRRRASRTNPAFLSASARFSSKWSARVETPRWEASSLSLFKNEMRSSRTRRALQRARSTDSPWASARLSAE